MTSDLWGGGGVCENLTLSDKGLGVTQFLTSDNSYFYTEILTGKVVLWCFFTSETQ